MSQILRTKRWAIITFTVEATRNDSIFISRRRGMAVAASLVWRVDSTKWPVRAAFTAIPAVSESLISPTKMIFGSCRRIERNPEATVRFVLGLTWTWLAPLILYSMGSSIVVMFFSLVFRIFKIA